jgi:hypothetical protein
MPPPPPRPKYCYPPPPPPLRPKRRPTTGNLAQPDLVNHPPHYTAGGIEVIDFIDAKQLGFCLGNVVKYVCRADHKVNRLEDLKKARWYLEHEIDAAEARTRVAES